MKQGQMGGGMKDTSSTSKRVLADGWKKEIAQTLRQLGLVDEGYTGKVVLNISRGVITDVERSERLK